MSRAPGCVSTPPWTVPCSRTLFSALGLIGFPFLPVHSLRAGCYEHCHRSLSYGLQPGTASPDSFNYYYLDFDWLEALLGCSSLLLSPFLRYDKTPRNQKLLLHENLTGRHQTPLRSRYKLVASKEREDRECGPHQRFGEGERAARCVEKTGSERLVRE